MTQTIDVTGNYLLDAGVTLSFTDHPAFRLIGDAPRLVIAGTARIKGDAPDSEVLTGVTSGFGDPDQAGETVIIRSTGTLSIDSVDYAEAVVLVHADAVITNNGRILVSAPGSASGLHTYAERAVITNAGLLSLSTGGAAIVADGADSRVDNRGTISVEGAGFGRAVQLGDDSVFSNARTIHVTGGEADGVIAAAGCTLTNTGAILVDATGHSTGVRIGAGSSVTNDGKLTVRGGDFAEGVALFRDAAAFDNSGHIVVKIADPEGTGIGLHLNSGPSGEPAPHISNTGVIRAGFAVLVYDAGEAEQHGFLIDNSGVMKGDVSMAAGDDQVANSGEIYGDIRLRDGADVYDGADGLLRGIVYGGVGDDQLTGGARAETLNGGEGADTLTGGGGADHFLYQFLAESLDQPDLIADLSGGDVIDLTAIDADISQDGDQAFHLAASLDGSKGALALSYDSVTDVTTLLGDIDGDRSAELVIHISGDATGYSHFAL